MKNKLLKIMSVVLSVCVIVALFLTMTRVSDITLHVTGAKSLDEGAIEEYLMQYEGKNIILLDKNEVIDGLTKAYPEVKVTAVVKSFPNQISVKVRERIPLFAVKTVAGFDFIDEEGMLIAKAQPQNFYIGLGGATLISATPEPDNLPGTVYRAGEGYSEMFAALRMAYSLQFDGEKLSALFSNVSVVDNTLRMVSRSGVTIIVDECSVDVEEKTQYALSAFMGCNDAQKLSGYLITYVNASGEIVTDWTREIA